MRDSQGIAQTRQSGNAEQEGAPLLGQGLGWKREF